MILSKDNIARQMKRSIICNVGPTNSGKTYKAMEHLSRSKGLFCGPLRLLAHEGYNTLKDKGCKVNLITGELRIEEHSNRSVDQICSTIEMANFNKIYPVAIIDEIQMISCSQRGFGWSNTLLNLPAETLYVCGEERAVPLVERLIKTYTDDDLHVNYFKRLGSLEIMKKPISMRDVKKGDCIVCFQRNHVLEYKSELEHLGLKVSVIYGTLPPNARVEQTRLFNEGVNDVIVGTDAIGMGLNLQIQRIIFSSHLKFDGKGLIPIEDPMVRQLAGRAGRYSSDIKEGIVTAFSSEVLRFINSRYCAVPLDVNSATLSFTFEDLKQIKDSNPSYSLKDILKQFFKSPPPKGFKYQDYSNIIRSAELMKPLINCSLRDQYVFLLAPVKLKSRPSMSEFFFIFLIRRFSQGKFADPFEFFRSFHPVQSCNVIEYNMPNLWSIYEESSNLMESEYKIRPLPTENDIPDRFDSKKIWSKVFKSNLSNPKNANVIEDMYSCLSLYSWIRSRFYFHPTFNYVQESGFMNSEVSNRLMQDAMEYTANLCSNLLEKPFGTRSARTRQNYATNMLGR
eukprot:NODE_447_length_8464_cov_0.381112.p1 type:complete len:567 gc:universal NODE_447_length_8464_cov_0.381112:6336-4636(-)